MTHEPSQYWVMGNPVSHSKSPQIHSLFAIQTHQTMTYQAHLVQEDGFSQALIQAQKLSISGMNVTVPFKQEASALADVPSQRVKLAGAANTLWFKGKTLYADNTDGLGLVMDLTNNLGWQLANKNILILGAGGAVRGVIEPLLSQQPAQLTVVNRTVDRALALRDMFASYGNINACSYSELGGQSYDIVINGTSASLSGNMPPVPPSVLTGNSCCYDMMYGKEPTVFMSWAKSEGILTIADGLGMLVEQAAESFLIWRGVRPETAPVIALLRQ